MPKDEQFEKYYHSNEVPGYDLEKIPNPFGDDLDFSLLNKGDDYELCFTAPKKFKEKISQISQE